MEKKILELLKTIKNKLDEHTQILRALEHTSEIDKVRNREDLTAVEIITSKN